MVDVVWLCCCCWFPLFTKIFQSQKSQFDSDVSTPSIHESWRPTRTRSGKLPHHGTKRLHYKVWTTYVDFYTTHRMLSKVNFRTAFPMYKDWWKKSLRASWKRRRLCRVHSEQCTQNTACTMEILGSMFAFGSVLMSNHINERTTAMHQPLNQENTMNGRRWRMSTFTPAALGEPKMNGRCWPKTRKNNNCWQPMIHRSNPSICDINCAKCYWIQLLRWKTVFCRAHCGTLQDDADADIQQHSSQIQITTWNIGSCWLYGTDFWYCSSDHSQPVHVESTWECRCGNVDYLPPSGGVCV